MDGPSDQDGTAVIIVSRLNGPEFALNPDLIERIDATPDSVVTLVDGTKYVVAESLLELVALIREFRASVIAEATLVEHGAPTAGRTGPRSVPDAREPSPVIPLPLKEV